MINAHEEIEKMEKKRKTQIPKKFIEFEFVIVTRNQGKRSD
jgi:hypothetical protein